MSVHGGKRGRLAWPEGHPLQPGQEFYNFFGVPDDRNFVHYFGTGYVDKADFSAVDQQVRKAKQEIAGRSAREAIERAAREAARLHP